MTNSEASILTHFRNRWQMLLYIECALYALGAGLFLFLVSGGVFAGLLAGLFVFGVSIAVRKPWRRDLKRVAAFVDTAVVEADYSSALLLSEADSLPGLSRLQRNRVAGQLREPVRRLIPPNGLLRALTTMTLLILLGVLAPRTGFFNTEAASAGRGGSPARIEFAPVDSLQGGTETPKLTGQRIRLDFPAYTNKPDAQTQDPNIRALIGTTILWELRFEGAVFEVIMERGGERFPLQPTGEFFTLRQVLDGSGFYSFRFSDSLGNWQVSDLYALEAIPDKPPTAKIEGVPQFTYFGAEDALRLDFTAQIFDDLGISDAYIVATVSKGSGESVKFREERLGFDTPLTPGTRSEKLSKILNLKQLQMDIGDELYFYVEALDRRQPLPNRGRSETYFAVIRDTASSAFAVEGSLGVDLMPDYFRSQRQLIIDTEKLIAEAPSLPVSEFKFRSNELGFDQKALRIKYGQFMGEESEMDLAPEESLSEDTPEGEDADHADPLAEFTHDHDGDNAHNLVAEGEGEKEEDPLHEYLHNHEDPEAATLFEESLRTKLRKALDVMWDAELHLRLYTPEASLPYQYEALGLLQEIKNSARIYVHRIGFDPPPIKEEKRLSGDIEGVSTYARDEFLEYEGSFPAMRQGVTRLQTLIEGNSTYTDADRELFRRAGQELAAKALEEPGRYLSLLRALKATETKSGRAVEALQELRQKLLQILPAEEKIPGLQTGNRDDMNTLFLKELLEYE